jgi:hypothetical protein
MMTPPGEVNNIINEVIQAMEGESQDSTSNESGNNDGDSDDDESNEMVDEPILVETNTTTKRAKGKTLVPEESTGDTVAPEPVIFGL